MSDSLGQARDRYLDYIREVRQLSPHTLSNYQRDLDAFVQWSESRGLTQAEKVQEADVRQWVSHLHRRGVAYRDLKPEYGKSLF